MYTSMQDQLYKMNSKVFEQNDTIITIYSTNVNKECQTMHRMSILLLCFHFSSFSLFFSGTYIYKFAFNTCVCTRI